MKGQVQEFRPKPEALDRILELASRPGHPDFDDIRRMATDTIEGAGLGFTASPEQAAAARQTIQDAKEKPSCPSTKKSP